MYTHNKQYLTAGAALENADAALIMIHGRGGTAQNILSLAAELNTEGFALLAPQATNQSWYPYSFMMPEKMNQPALDSAIDLLGDVVKLVIDAGIPRERVVLAGFSQGACLALEFIARSSGKYGGVIAFTGGLPGKELDKRRYTGDLKGTSILITTGHPDQHVPLNRVEESVAVLKDMHADVTLRVFNNRMHTITEEEILLANEFIIEKVLQDE